MNPKQGGPCQGIRNSIPEMKKHGVENEIVCFDSSDSEYPATDDFSIHTIGPAKGPYAYCAQLNTWLEQNISRFDVVIIHGMWLYNGYGTYRVWKKFRKENTIYPKLYVMPHGMLDPYFQKAKGRKLKAIRNWVFWKLVEGKVVNNVDGILFTCEEELLLARKSFSPYHPKEELNVGYGILPPPAFNESMTDAFRGKCSGWNGKPFFLFLSRIHEKKGVDLLVKAYTQLSEDNKDIPQLIIAGPGAESPYGQQMLALAAGCEKIKFCGMLSDDSKWGAFYNCEAFVLPSHQENFGIAIVEAMACGKPVLITDKVNIWREIGTGNAGLIDNDTQEGIYRLLNKWSSFAYKEKTLMYENVIQIYRDKFNVKEAVKTMLYKIGDINNK